ncbi:MAG: TetR/AcrR family transcriptional regulator [Candidatus Izemoplasmatales bacterium]|jgi:AcrR family transcriptional regulator|nr:TetR/AcrR family transcriptional regulator [Candidatus Izemoplasmatales bacterium]MDD4595855.1 TetR/AcrR family transcriptional regulator [Candidatus Izemoplasmatales bacterium]
MPTTTYYNIVKEKQKKIIEVGVDLFSKNPFENVDIQMVVNKSGLPRGSFYAYFENLEDYYNLVISTLRADRIRKVENLAEGFEGNLFDFLIKLFKYDIAQYTYDERKLLLTHYFRFLQTRKMGSLEGTIYHPSQKIGIYTILDSFKTGCAELDQFSKKKAAIIDFSMTVYLSTYNVCVHDKMSELESLELFIERIKIIEKGVM